MEGPKILTLDIENSPVRGYVWSLWRQNVALNQIERDWYMLTWAAKWMHEDEVQGDSIFHYKAEYKEHPESDYYILLSLRDLLDEADIVVGWNSKAFDIPKINARMIDWGIPMYSPFQQIDAMQIAKKQFRFTSNKLEYVSRKLGCGGKMETGGFELWSDCMNGKPEAWKKMLDYNMTDVIRTEDTYLKLRPWSKSHPNHSLYTADGLANSELMCNKCGSEALIRYGYAYTNLGKFQEYHCKGCGCYPRGRKNLKNLENVLTNVI